MANRKRHRAHESALMLVGSDAKEIDQIVPISRFQALPFWEKLNTNQKANLQEEGTNLAAAMMMHGASGLAIGEHLFNVNQMLKPINGAWSRFVKDWQFKNERTAYRYVQRYKNAKNHLPQNVLKAAMGRNISIYGDKEERPLGAYTEAVKILPPPRNPDIEAANRYLDQLEETRKMNNDAQKKFGNKDGEVRVLAAPATSKNKEMWTMHVYRMFRSRFRRLPSSKTSDARKEFVKTVIGMILTEAGVSGGNFGAIAIPEEFRAERGRPRESQAATA
jgi:hypothetical protein